MVEKSTCWLYGREAGASHFTAYPILAPYSTYFYTPSKGESLHCLPYCWHLTPPSTPSSGQSLCYQPYKGTLLLLLLLAGVSHFTAYLALCTQHGHLTTPTFTPSSQAVASHFTAYPTSCTLLLILLLAKVSNFTVYPALAPYST